MKSLEGKQHHSEFSPRPLRGELSAFEKQDLLQRFDNASGCSLKSDYKSMSCGSLPLKINDKHTIICNTFNQEKDHASQNSKNQYELHAIESSAENCDERIIQSCATPSFEDSGRVQESTMSEIASNKPCITSIDESARGSKDGKSDVDETIKPRKAFSLRSLTRDQMIILIASCSANLLNFLNRTLMAPFFPIEADKKGVNIYTSGWIFGVFALAQFLTSPVIGRLVPVVGCKFMLISGLFVCGGCTVLFGVVGMVDTSASTVPFVTLCLATRIVMSFGCTGLSNSGFVLLTEYFPDSVATAIGIGEVFTGIGVIFGPALGGFLYAAGGYILPFALIGVCPLVAIPFAWYFIPEQNRQGANDKRDESKSITKMFVHPRTLVNDIVVILIGAMTSMFGPTLEPELRMYGLTPDLVGVLFLGMAVAYSGSAPIVGRIADKIPDNKILLIAGSLVCAISLFMMGPSPVLGFKASFYLLWFTVLSVIVFGLGTSLIIIPSYNIYIANAGDMGYPQDQRTYGMVSGLWFSMFALGGCAGPSIGGFLSDMYGFDWMTTWFGVASIVTTVLVFLTWLIEKKLWLSQR